MLKKSKSRGLLIKLMLFATFFAIVAGAGSYFILLPRPDTEKPVNTVISDKLFGWKFPVAKFPLTGPNSKLLAYSNIRDPGGIPQGLPVRLKIPVIGVDSAIEDALITTDGRMDVPAGSVNVAWFALGPHPGKEGSAVIGGHFGIDNGIPKVFYNLDKLKRGDKIYIEDDTGDTLAFVVRSIKLFDRNADATTVFTSADGLAHLNLITCEGVWNQVNDSYPDRRVIFTDSIPGEGKIAVNPKLPEAAATIPIPTPSLAPSEIPSPSVTPAPLSTTFIASTKSLYATPLDGLITSFLLIAVVFMAFKITRR